MTFKLKHPYYETIIRLASLFKKHNYELFVVGGTIRDALLGGVSTDIDLATNATPEKIEKICNKTLATGKKYGTITIFQTYQNKTIPMQITTYRSEGNYADKRHPDTVKFETSLQEDIKRRDFTMNALAYDPLTEELIDYVNAQQDLKKKIIRVVGDPITRFNEDSLRLIRCCRFIAQLEFNCDKKTWDALCKLAKIMTLPAKERITIELLKLVSSKHPSLGIDALIQSGLGDRLLPGLSQVNQAVLQEINTIPIDIRLAYLLKELDLQICFNMLSLSKQQQRWIHNIIRYDFDQKKAAFQKTDLALSGLDIKAMGFIGKQIGIIQQACYEYVMQDFTNNTKQKLQQFIYQRYK
tara:strand:+ start:17158 stop:18219 length:1062 start_codon:yes stop_codon:yes gene_type:complete